VQSATLIRPGLGRGSSTALPLLIAVAALGATGMNIILPSLLNFSIYGIGALVTALVGTCLDASGTAAMAAVPVVTIAAFLARLASR